MKVATNRGPTGDWCCPRCGNCLQNAVPGGCVDLRRCANCKELFSVVDSTDASKELDKVAELFTSWWIEHHDDARFFNEVVKASRVCSEKVKRAL